MSDVWNLLKIFTMFLLSNFNSINGSENSKMFDPDTYLLTNKLIQRQGYPSESHEVTTEDGYILTMHRIPHGKQKTSSENLPPVFLQHGLLGSSSNWVISGPESSLAYLLADKGHDVWLGNTRGNTYSRGHVSMSPNDRAFWNYSFHDVGTKDLAAMIDYVLKLTNQEKLYYIGHSMGTTTFFVLCSVRPEYNDKVVTMFALAPVAFMSHAKTPLRYLAPFSQDIELILRLFGPGEFLPRNYFMKFILKFACELTAVEVKMCENDLFIICGHDPKQFNSELMPRILGHTPAGSSTKNMIHYSQEMVSGYFRQFDYGKKKNEIIYGSKEPPKYNLSNVIVPVSLHYADNDFLANPKDVLQLSNLLPNVISLNRVEYPRFNHLDFIWSKNVNLYVNDKILTTIDKINVNGEVPKSYSISKVPETSFDSDIPLNNDILTLFEQEVTRIAKEYLNNDFKDTKIDTDKILFNLKLEVKKVLRKINKNFQNRFLVSMKNGLEESNATDTNERLYS